MGRTRDPVQEISLLDELAANVPVNDQARDASPVVVISEATWQSLVGDVVASAEPKAREGAGFAAQGRPVSDGDSIGF